MTAAPSVVTAVLTSRRRVLIGRRHDGTPPWAFVGGEITPGETAAQAAVREAREETGLQVAVQREIGRRTHPTTGRAMVYLACRPAGGANAVADGRDLAEVRWVSLQEAERLMPDMHGPVRAYLAQELAA